MRFGGARVVLRPRGPLEVVDLAVRLVQDGGLALPTLSAVTLLPWWLLLVAVALLTPYGPVAALVPLVLGPVLQAPFLVWGRHQLFEPSVPVRTVLREAVGAWREVAVGVGRGLFVLLAGVASLGMLLIPAQATLQFLGETSMLEQLPLRSAVARSVRLATDQPGRAVGGLFVGWALVVWTVLSAELCGQLLFGFVLQAGAPFGSLDQGVVTPFALAGLLLVQPALALVRLLLYVDLRTVAEGWDLQVALVAAAEEG